MPAASLQIAASLSYDHMSNQWQIDALKTQLAAFCAALLPLFPDSNVNSRPIANWLTVQSAQAQNMGSTEADVPVTVLSTAAQTMFKMLWLTDALKDQNLVSSAQATAVLAAFNTYFPT